jgi:quinol monooxygenase YgiN
MIVVLASIELNGGKREAFLAEFRRIEYFPSLDHATHLPVQGPLRDDVVVVVEKWESVAALEAHLIAPHMMEYRPKVKDFVKKVSLQILEPVG